MEKLALLASIGVADVIGTAAAADDQGNSILKEVAKWGSYLLKRPQHFGKSPPYFWLQYTYSKVKSRFPEIFWPSQNTLTLYEVISKHFWIVGSYGRSGTVMNQFMRAEDQVFKLGPNTESLFWLLFTVVIKKSKDNSKNILCHWMFVDRPSYFFYLKIWFLATFLPKTANFRELYLLKSGYKKPENNSDDFQTTQIIQYSTPTSTFNSLLKWQNLALGVLVLINLFWVAFICPQLAMSRNLLSFLNKLPLTLVSTPI